MAYIRIPCCSAFRRTRYHQGIRRCLWHRHCAFDLSLGFHSRRPEGSGWCGYSESSPPVQLRRRHHWRAGYHTSLWWHPVRCRRHCQRLYCRPPERFSGKKRRKQCYHQPWRQRPLHRLKAQRHSLQDRHPEAFCRPQWNRGCYGYRRKIRCILWDLWEVL